MRSIRKAIFHWILRYVYVTSHWPIVWSSMVPTSTVPIWKDVDCYTKASCEVSIFPYSKLFIHLSWEKYLIRTIFVLEDEFACDFLLKHGALPTAVLPDTGDSPLHLLAEWKTEEVAQVARLLLKQGSGPNALSQNGR